VVNKIKRDSKMIITVAILIKIKVGEWTMMDLQIKMMIKWIMTKMNNKWIMMIMMINKIQFLNHLKKELNL